jgi:hypothetical protein
VQSVLTPPGFPSVFLRAARPPELSLPAAAVHRAQSAQPEAPASREPLEWVEKH